MSEVLLYASHSDPQLRGNTALVIGRLVRAGLGEGHGSWDGWLASLLSATECSMLTLLVHQACIIYVWQCLCPLYKCGFYCVTLC